MLFKQKNWEYVVYGIFLIFLSSVLNENRTASLFYMIFGIVNLLFAIFQYWRKFQKKPKINIGLFERYSSENLMYGIIFLAFGLFLATDEKWMLVFIFLGSGHLISFAYQYIKKHRIAH